MTQAQKVAARDKQIVESYQQLGNGHAVAKALGLSSPTVYAALRRQSVKLLWRRGRERIADEKIVEAYKRLGSGIAVARELHTSEHTVYVVLAQHGIETGTYWKTLRQVVGDDARRAILQYRDGRTVPQIARTLQVSATAVRAALDREQVYVSNRIVWLDADKERVAELYRSGMRPKQVSLEVGRPAWQILRMLSEDYPHLVRPKNAFGKDSPTWNGGRVVHHGYVYVIMAPDDPFAPQMRSAAGYVPEHRIVKARELGRPLTLSETVHHIDGNRKNNAPDNLQLRRGKHGAGSELCCADCGSHNIVSVPLTES